MQKEKPTTETNVDKENLVQVEVIEKSILSIVGNEKAGYALCIGKHRLTDFMPTQKAVMTWMNKYKWEAITTIMATMIGIYLTDTNFTMMNPPADDPKPKGE